MLYQSCFLGREWRLLSKLETCFNYSSNATVWQFRRVEERGVGDKFRRRARAQASYQIFTGIVMAAEILNNCIWFGLKCTIMLLILKTIIILITTCSSGWLINLHLSDTNKTGTLSPSNNLGHLWEQIKTINQIINTLSLLYCNSNIIRHSGAISSGTTVLLTCRAEIAEISQHR